MSVQIMYFVHGTTYDNAESKCSGWKQVKLNELGEEQAANLGKNTNYKFDALHFQLLHLSLSFFLIFLSIKKRFTFFVPYLNSILSFFW